MRPLQKQSLLVVEDDYMLASDLTRQLTEAGAAVLGPAATESQALDILQTTRPDAAVLDLNLRGEVSWAIADTLLQRGIPFVFASAYDCAILPPRFANIPFVEKPCTHRALMIALLSGRPDFNARDISA